MKYYFMILSAIVLFFTACSAKNSTTEPETISYDKADSLYGVICHDMDHYMMNISKENDSLYISFYKNQLLKKEKYNNISVKITIDGITYNLIDSNDDIFINYIPVSINFGDVLNFLLRVDIELNNAYHTESIHKSYNSSIRISSPVNLLAPEFVTDQNQSYHLYWQSEKSNQYQLANTSTAQQNVVGGWPDEYFIPLHPDSRDCVMPAQVVPGFDTDYFFSLGIIGFSFRDLGEIKVFSMCSDGVSHSITPLGFSKSETFLPF